MRKRCALAATLVVLLAAPSLASAQGGPGFLFKRPTFSIGIRAGWVMPRSGGQLLEYTVDEFIPLGASQNSTLSFDSPYIGGELSVRPWERWDVTAGFGWTRSRQRTEYRDWADDVGSAAIQQETTLQVVSGTLGAKYYVRDRGRQVGSLAWIPSRFAPYVGGGVGFSSYEFRQVGDFVDTSDCTVVDGEESCAIQSDYLETTGYGAVAYGSAGVDLAVTKNALLTAEARYSFSNADVRGSYVGFNDIDLSGLRLMLGLGFQF